METKIDYRSKFQKIKDKKIIIYGTGVISQRIIKALTDFHIVGVIDRLQFSGEIEGVQIRMWDEIYEEDADVIIIAALSRNYKEIYNRIIDRCIAYDMKIYGADGQNLISKYGILNISKENNNFFNKCEEELYRKIKMYEAISFDLFDTLVMRKNLEPSDLFDILEKKVQKKGITIPNLKKYRRKAELMSKGDNIYVIYDIFHQITGISVEECDTILQEEIECEKEYIIPREKMIEVMKYAIALGKRVNIITNMYLPEDILAGILRKMGIEGYERIYVSCEYGVSKGNGLFEKYLEKVIADNYLHIGDDEYEDILSAKRYGLDAYGIKSAYEMLKISNYRQILAYSRTCNEKGMIGLLISELFNNPFVLYNTNGVVCLSDCRLFGKIFIAPIVIVYILHLVKLLKNTKDIRGVLFGSRDGYLLKKIYDKLCSVNSLKMIKYDTWYFMTSRKLSLKASMKSEEQIKILEDYGVNERAKEVLTQIFGIENIPDYDEKNYSSLSEYYMTYKDKILEKSSITRKNYYKYMDNCGVERDGKYILCELISQGTVQYALDQILDSRLLGFYLCKRKGFVHFDVSAESCYYEKDNYSEIIFENNNFLESILTAPHASVLDMDESGNSIYSVEEREEEEIDMVLSIQEGIEEFFFEYINIMYIEEIRIGELLPLILMNLRKDTYLKEKCKNLENRKLFDDFAEVYCNI